MKLTDPHKWIISVKVAGEDTGRAMVVIEWRGREPLYKLETRPLRAILTIKEDGSKQRVVLELSGLPFPPRTTPDRIIMITHGQSR